MNDGAKTVFKMAGNKAHYTIIKRLEFLEAQL